MVDRNAPRAERRRQGRHRRVRGNVVNDRLGPHLRRETRAILASRGRLGTLLVLCVLTRFVAPFGTFAASPIERHLYWTAVFVGTLAAGHTAITVLYYQVARRGWQIALRLAAGTLVGALPVTGVVAALSVPFGLWSGLWDLAEIYGRCAIVVGAVLAIVEFASAPTRPAAPPRTPAILRCLPGARRGRLVRLTAQDHHVEVVTTHGRALVTMRLADAVGETDPTPGARVHRSHWIATDAVTGWTYAGGRLRLRLTDGSSIPIGRTYRAAARAAGLLPHRDGAARE
jgi:hypothetical protein